jgi:hypothetical protein
MYIAMCWGKGEKVCYEVSDVAWMAAKKGQNVHKKPEVMGQLGLGPPEFPDLRDQKKGLEWWWMLERSARGLLSQHLVGSGVNS